MEKIHTLKPYLIEAVYEWCLDNDMGTYLEVLKDNKKMLFDISSNYVASLFFEEEGVSFITIINNNEKQVFIGYVDIVKVFSKAGGHGLDFSTMETFEETKKNHLMLVVNNLNKD